MKIMKKLLVDIKYFFINLILYKYTLSPIRYEYKCGQLTTHACILFII